jgi:mono/diheme cytochrome c family protein
MERTASCRTILAASVAMAIGCAAVAARAATPLPQQADNPKRIWDGVFTAEQAARGKSGFEISCSRCHNEALVGSERGPALKGSAFLSHWENDTLGGLFVKIRDTMPQNDVGTISDNVKIDILAYVLQQNGFPAGSSALAAQPAGLDDIRVSRRDVWDGVFTAAQAERGKNVAQQGRCTGCHGPELAGSERAPALKGDAFLSNWEDGSVNRLFVKIRDTMPPSNAEQVAAAEKLDVLAYVLRVNGFPAGASDLRLDADTLDAIQIARKRSDAGPQNFTLVQVVGCLTQDSDSRWTLARTSQPIVTKDDAASPAALGAAASRPLGTQTFRLLSVNPSYQVDAHKGHKVEARGLLYREDQYGELNLTSLQMVAPTCAK